MRSIFLKGFALLTFLLSTSSVSSQETIMIEARRLPSTCVDPLLCVPMSELVLRNIASFSNKESREVMSFINRISSVRGLTDERYDQLNSSKRAIADKYHPSEMSEKLLFLRQHPGFYFDTEVLDGANVTQSFGGYIKTQLQGAGVTFLTKQEWENTPGRPQIKVRYSDRRESEGCIIPFSVSLTISEEAVLVRDADLKVPAVIWSKTVRQNLANRNYTVQSALREAVEYFLEDWRAAK
ncbi:hypothetical protein [Cognatishimia activa]|uniref:Uncharacterized protein n=1 Tax=Cognatishimia activa TaxID=1715691 RepID=A0A0P1INL9_9RHOB|nr:hypothetical protein [Cognatishimia activa]CUJ09130.1 hypothetical protein TA5113_02267 [Cognatishimia activa]CUK25207.1 hypothetical protein TA5114_00998 [Cognatishimia activa]